MKIPAYLHFDGMTWPNPDDPDEVQHALRYGTPTREQLLIAALCIAAYRKLVSDSAIVRNAKVAGIRRAAQGGAPKGGVCDDALGRAHDRMRHGPIPPTTRS